MRDIGDARYELRADAATAEPLLDSAASSGDLRPRRTALLLAGTGLAAVALTFAVMSFRSPSLPTPDSMIFPIPAPPDTRLEQVAISPDGRSLAFAAESPAGVTEVWIRDLDSRAERRVAGTEGARDLFWSPDSRSIGFFKAERLWKLEVESGAIESLTLTPQARGGSWNRQNTMVVGGSLGLLRIEANEGSLETTLALDTPSGENAIRFPSFLPDGIHVLFYSRNPKDRDRAGLWVGEIETGARTQLTAAASSSAVYVEPGYLLYRRDRYLVAHPFDAVLLAFTGDPVTVADDIWYEPGVTALTNVSVSTTGTVVFRTGGPEMSDLAWFDRQGQARGTVWEPNSFLTVGLSPDGTQVLTGFPSQGPERKVWLYDLPSATARQLETLGDLQGNTLFSGDGARAILGVSADATLKPWLMDLASGARPEPLGPTTASNPTDWHEELIVYEANLGQSQSIRLFDLATGDDRVLVDGPGNEEFAVVSPDGRWLAYISDETGEWEVYVATFPDTGRRWRISTAGGYQPRWNPRRGELVYLAPDRRMMSVLARGETAEFQWDAPQPLFQTAIVDLGLYRGTGTFAVAPDGERFLILTRKPQSASSAMAILNWR